MCDRTVCDEESTHRVYNNPSTVEGYREYCEECCNGIIRYNPELKFEPIVLEKIQKRIDKLSQILDNQETVLPMNYILAEHKFQTGKKDRLLGKPCSSNNDAYLNGWYSDKDFYYITEGEFECL